MNDKRVIRVLRPSLPGADLLLPYLRRIDAARTYTNWGPLTGELESRLCRHLHAPENSVVSASSGTAALTGTILAGAGRASPERPFAAIPAFTFVATAFAVEQCGYQPYLIDVDSETWALDAARMHEHPLLDRIGLVVPVGAFGRSVPQRPWREFRERTGIPVVIDAAACFESFAADSDACVGDVPAVLSFHATKSFSTAEGGCAITTDSRLSMRVEECLNFGFYSNRHSVRASTNGKMSEYHAAIGLADLDRWSEKSSNLDGVFERYRARLRLTGLGHRFIGPPTVASCYALFRCHSAREAAGIRDTLRRSGVEFRLWYGRGLSHHPYFSALPGDPLPNTETVAPLIIGLPIAVDLSMSEIDRIVMALTSATESCE